MHTFRTSGEAALRGFRVGGPSRMRGPRGAEGVGLHPPAVHRRPPEEIRAACFPSAAERMLRRSGGERVPFRVFRRQPGKRATPASPQVCSRGM
ncbi:hypothetical protein GCM10023405_16290 [Streptomonospora salina]